MSELLEPQHSPVRRPRKRWGRNSAYCGGRGEVECPAGMPGQPLAHLRMFVGRIVVDDGVDHFSHRDLLLARVEEGDELLVAMALHVAADDGAVEDVWGC